MIEKVEIEFLEWLIFSDDSPFWYEKHDGKNMYWQEETDTYHTLDEVYKYRIDNVKLKHNNKNNG